MLAIFSGVVSQADSALDFTYGGTPLKDYDYTAYKGFSELVYEVHDITATVTGSSADSLGNTYDAYLGRYSQGLGVDSGRHDGHTVDGKGLTDSVNIEFSEEVSLLSASFGWYQNKVNYKKVVTKVQYIKRYKWVRKWVNGKKVWVKEPVYGWKNKTKWVVDSVLLDNVVISGDLFSDLNLELPEHKSVYEGISTIDLSSFVLSGTNFAFAAPEHDDSWKLAGITFSKAQGGIITVPVPAPAAALIGLPAVALLVGKRRRA